MTESQLTVRVGLGLIMAHFFIFVTIVWAWAVGGMTFSEFLTTASVIVPLFTGYTILIAGFFWKTRLLPPALNEPKVSAAWTVTVSLFAAFFVVALIASVIAKATNTAFKDFEQFKVALLLIETLFASLSSFAIKALFKGSEDGH